MRKRIIEPARPDGASTDDRWLDLDALAEVEVSSEDPAHPVERALLPGQGTGWRAGAAGRQTIRIIFAQPQALSHIRLHFVDEHAERAQEYVLRWSPDGGTTYRDIVRQQWNFSPRGATSEIEDHRVELAGVTVIELCIDPDTGGRNAVASLQALRLA